MTGNSLSVSKRKNSVSNRITGLHGRNPTHSLIISESFQKKHSLHHANGQDFPSINQSIERLAKNRSIDQSINQSNERSINQSNDRSMEKCIRYPPKNDASLIGNSYLKSGNHLWASRNDILRHLLRRPRVPLPHVPRPAQHDRFSIRINIGHILTHVKLFQPRGSHPHDLASNRPHTRIRNELSRSQSTAVDDGVEPAMKMPQVSDAFGEEWSALLLEFSPKISHVNSRFDNQCGVIATVAPRATEIVQFVTGESTVIGYKVAIHFGFRQFWVVIRENVSCIKRWNPCRNKTLLPSNTVVHVHFMMAFTYWFKLSIDWLIGSIFPYLVELSNDWSIDWLIDHTELTFKSHLLTEKSQRLGHHVIYTSPNNVSPSLKSILGCRPDCWLGRDPVERHQQRRHLLFYCTSALQSMSPAQSKDKKLESCYRQNIPYSKSTAIHRGMDFAGKQNQEEEKEGKRTSLWLVDWLISSNCPGLPRYQE